jgi:M6 family metalloprotease-like protein
LNLSLLTIYRILKQIFSFKKGVIMKRLLLVLIMVGSIMMATPSFTSATDLSRSIIYDVPSEIMEKQFGEIPGSQLTPQDSLSIAEYRFNGDTLKLLVILLEWTNRPGTYSKETFDSLLFSSNVFPGGSVAEYFNEVSYGHLYITGEVKDWYNAGTYYGHYSFRSLFPKLDSIIDYSQFDGNNDGYVDAITVIRSGNGQEDSNDENDIWSYASNFAPGFEIGPLDGVYIDRYNTCPETRPLHDPLYPPAFTGEDTLSSIAVFCHELAHNIGLPDLYDYDSRFDISACYTPNDDNDHPLSDWCLMGDQGGLLSFRALIPSHLCGWSKNQMGWIDPLILPSGTQNQVVIYNIETTKDSSLYMTPIIPSEGEYFLLEYRNPHSIGMFDKFDSDFSCYFWPYLSYGSDSLDRGLLITHVHDSLCLSNNGTPTYPHYRIAVEDAGYNPAKDTSYNPEGHVTDSAQWWYPYETRKAAVFSSEVSGQELFGPTTTPNSDGYSGPSGIKVRVDSIIDDKLYAYVFVPMWGDADGDKEVSVSDVIYLINYLFKGGPPPVELLVGDVNCDGGVGLPDVVYLINYLFKSGPPPCET